nr:AraC family transcriptional regulator N-terminal domain-containing protein [Pseudomonas coleopterorum]
MANDTRRLAQALSRWARNDGDHETPVPGLTLHRRHKLTMPLHYIYGLGLGLTVQGRKQVIVGEDLMTYGPGQSMVTSIDMPVISNVIQASVAQPFLGMMLNIDASSAGGLVGYESSSQFSREYSRLFGHPPQRDIKRMRVQ